MYGNSLNFRYEKGLLLKELAKFLYCLNNCVMYCIYFIHKKVLNIFLLQYLI